MDPHPAPVIAAPCSAFYAFDAMDQQLRPWLRCNKQHAGSLSRNQPGIISHNRQANHEMTSAPSIPHQSGAAHWPSRGLKTSVQEHRLGHLPDAGSSRGLHHMSDVLAAGVQPGVGRVDLVLMAGAPSQTLRRRPGPVRPKGCHSLQDVYIRCKAFHGMAFVNRRHLTPDVGPFAP